MSAKEIKGLPAAEEIRAGLQVDIDKLKAVGLIPRLAVILAGDDPGSVWYAQSKVKIGEKMGIQVDVIRFPADIRCEQLERCISALNADDSVHGILIELPLPKHIDKAVILNKISPLKDVDGVTAVNRGYIMGGQEHLALVPATPLACVELAERSGILLKGRRVTLVGRGDTVGRPLAALLVNRDATVTICHTKTVDLAGECRKAEVIFAAAGRKNLITVDMVADNAIVIDAGINELEDGSFTGDVDYDAVKAIAGAVTPVPGGVGNLTTTIIMANTVKALKQQKGIGG